MLGENKMATFHTIEESLEDLKRGNDDENGRIF